MHACMYTYMTRVISISDDAYEALKKLKAGRSFSKIIIEIVKEKKNNLLDFAGIISEAEAEEVKRDIYESRKLKSRRFS